MKLTVICDGAQISRNIPSKSAKLVKNFKSKIEKPKKGKGSFRRQKSYKMEDFE